MIPILVRRRESATVLACLGLLLIGWSYLLVPGLAPEVEAAFGQNDVGLGGFYLATAGAYAVGSFVGGMASERIGRRTILVLAAALHAIGLVGQGIAPGWAAFVVAGVVRSLGAGAIDGGMNGLIVDLYGANRGRALSFAHLFYALGGVGAPFLLALRFPLGLSWQAVIVGSGLATIPLIAALAVMDASDAPREKGRHPAAVTGTSMLSVPLVILALSIGLYVGASSGVSNWLVRFLSDANSGTATSALGFFWTGLVAGRLLNAFVADRFDHVKLAVFASGSATVGIVAATMAPGVESAIAIFAMVGFFSGPIYPLIMTIGGDRFPGRAAAMSGILSAAGVLGSLAYPPLMGVISVTAGLHVAMLGVAVLLGGASVALAVVGRISRPAPRVSTAP